MLWIIPGFPRWEKLVYWRHEGLFELPNRKNIAVVV